jgi:DNA-binding NtrC family response regulator
MHDEFLIVDRDPLIRECCRKCLQARGYRVSVAADGLQCLEQLRKNPPDILVLDPDVLWGGGEGIIDYVVHDHLGHPPFIVLADGRSRPIVMPELRRQIAARLERPSGLDQLDSFVDELEVLHNVFRQQESKAGALSLPQEVWA